MRHKCQATKPPRSARYSSATRRLVVVVNISSSSAPSSLSSSSWFSHVFYAKMRHKCQATKPPRSARCSSATRRHRRCCQHVVVVVVVIIIIVIIIISAGLNSAGFPLMSEWRGTPHEPSFPHTRRTPSFVRRPPRTFCIVSLVV